MSRRLADDLARWEAGDLPLEAVEVLHPEAEVEALVALHARLGALRAEPVPDPARSWPGVLSRLREPAPGLLSRIRARTRRPLVAALAAAVLGSGFAFAAPPVRRAAGRVWSGVVRLFGGSGEPAPDVVRRPAHEDLRSGGVPGPGDPGSVQRREEEVASGERNQKPEDEPGDVREGGSDDDLDEEDREEGEDQDEGDEDDPEEADEPEDLDDPDDARDDEDDEEPDDPDDDVDDRSDDDHGDGDEEESGEADD